MFGRRIPGVEPGRPIRARTLNKAIAAGDESRRMRVGFGLAYRMVSGIAVLGLSRRPGRTLHAVVGSSAIAAATSATQMTGATVTVQVADPNTGKLASAGYTLKAWNKAVGGTIPANAPILITLDDDGLWIITWWECS